MNTKANEAEVSRKRLPCFLDMLIRYGNTNITLRADHKKDCWVVTWDNKENGK